jgi:hypothetical protein
MLFSWETIRFGSLVTISPQNDEEEKTIMFGCVLELKPSFHTTSFSPQSQNDG